MLGEYAEETTTSEARGAVGANQETNAPAVPAVSCDGPTIAFTFEIRDSLANELCAGFDGSIENQTVEDLPRINREGFIECNGDAPFQR